MSDRAYSVSNRLMSAGIPLNFKHTADTTPLINRIPPFAFLAPKAMRLHSVGPASARISHLLKGLGHALPFEAEDEHLSLLAQAPVPKNLSLQAVFEQTFEKMGRNGNREDVLAVAAALCIANPDPSLREVRCSTVFRDGQWLMDETPSPVRSHLPILMKLGALCRGSRWLQSKSAITQSGSTYTPK